MLSKFGNFRNFRKPTNIYLVNRNLHVKNNTNPVVLSEGCLNFIEKLNDKCITDYNDCINLRKYKYDNKIYGFRDDTIDIRKDYWKIHNIPKALQCRYVELTGPGNNPKMIINALNTSANGYMLDLEDSMSPSWNNVMNAHTNIMNAVRGELTTYNNGKKYKINNENIPSFFVRVRGLHMKEENVLDDNWSTYTSNNF